MLQIVKNLIKVSSLQKPLTRLPQSQGLFSYKSRTQFSSEKQPINQEEINASSNKNTKSSESESNIYEQNLQDLKEISKEVFAKIEKYNTKRKYEIFLTYSSYRLLDQNTFNIIEKDFIKNLNSFTSEQLINILDGLIKIQMGSEKLQMLMEQYFTKNVHNITIKECVKLTRILHKAFNYRDEASPRTSKRLCESLHLYFMNKLNEFDSMQKIQMMIGLLQLLKSRKTVYTESLDLVFERLSTKIPSFSKQEVILFGHLFFSNFLQQKEIQLAKREKAIDSVNQIMFGRIELTENSLKQNSSQVLNNFSQQNHQQPEINSKQDSNEQNIQEQEQNDNILLSQQIFDQKSNFRKILKSFNSCIIKNIQDFQAKDYQKILEIFELQQVPIDSSIQQHFEKYVKENYLDFTPKELYSLSPFIDIRYIQMYLQNYKSELEYIDLLNFFKCVQMQSSPSYEQSLRIVDSRIFQIHEKWDLDECVYILFAREDQHQQFKKNNDKLFKEEREEFMRQMMHCVNKELQIRNKNHFKVYNAIWKVLFRSELKLESVYVLHLLQNMRQNITISVFEQFIRVVEILENLAFQYPEFSDAAKHTLAVIEDRYSINDKELNRQNIDQNETKQIDQNK